MRILNLRRARSAAFVSLALLAGASAAQAGDDVAQCPLTKAAHQLTSCVCCQQFKQLLDSAEGTKVSLQIFEMQHGLMLRFAGADPAAVATIQSVVDRLWRIGDLDATGLCPDCAHRYEKLQQAERDRALTDDGAIVVLSTDDPQTLQWLRKDANQARDLIQSASLR